MTQKKENLKSDFLQVENLYKKWDEFSLDISFCASEKSFTSIVGPSGSGKSTVLRIISGLEKSDKREDGKKAFISLDGQNITDENPNKRKCGMVFQNNSLFLNMSVIDNVAFGLKCLGVPKKERYEKARMFLAKFEMQDFEKRNPASLSGGEAQRVALARTLIVNPKLILFDEPLSALDAPLRKKLASEICSMQAEFGFTALMVTHDINEAKMMSDSIIMIKSGKLTWHGKSSEFEEKMIER